LHALSSFSDNDTDCTESIREYDSEPNSDVYMRMEDDVNALDGVDFDVNVDMERDGEDEEDAEGEDEKQEEDVDEDDEEDEDEDENNGKEPRTSGQEETVNTSADAADTMVDD